LAEWHAGRGALLAAALVLSALPTVLLAGEKRPKQIKMVGLTTAVEPTRVTIVGRDASEVTIVCKEDFTSKVGVGSQVTAWYTPKDGVNYLDWLEYPLENFFVPANEIRETIKKIIILPNSSVPDSQGIVDGIGKYLETNLGWYVAPRMLAEEIRRRSKRSDSTLAYIDPATGQFNMDRYLRAQRALIVKLVSETRVHAVLEVNVEQVQARFIAQVAVWDGVEQAMATKAVRTLALLAHLPEDGQVPAATVEMKLWGPQGKLLWSNRRGFAVLAVQTGLGNKFRDRLLIEVYQDQASVEKWLVMTLGTLAPPKTSGCAPAPTAPEKGSDR